MQLKYSFKKEWSLFSRTGRLIGVIIALLFFALSNPLLFKFTGTVLQEMQDLPNNYQTTFASITAQNPNSANSTDNSALGIDYGDMVDMYSNSGIMYGVTMANVCSNSLLVIMLLLMTTAGGEQKKRSMIVPLCSGLKDKNYLLSKFLIYPPVVCVATAVSSLIAGVLCNAMFPVNQIDPGILLLASVLAGVYMLFVTSIYLSLGICTSRPGVMTAAVYIGTMLIQSLLEGMGLPQFHPFTLLTLVGGGMFTDDFVLSDNIANIAVSVGLSLLISVLMYFLALGVLGAKRIDNKEEVKPEF